MQAPLSTPNATWTLSVAPKGGWHSPWRIATKSALALLLAAGVASLAWTLMELRRRQSQMQATLKTVPDLMFELHGQSADAVTIEWRCSASIGVALFGAEETDVAPLIHRADAAVYAAKAAGRDAVHISEAASALTAP